MAIPLDLNYIKNYWLNAIQAEWNWGYHRIKMAPMKRTHVVTMWEPRAGTRNVGRPRKRWCDVMCLKSEMQAYEVEQSQKCESAKQQLKLKNLGSRKWLILNIYTLYYTLFYQETLVPLGCI